MRRFKEFFSRFTISISILFLLIGFSVLIGCGGDDDDDHRGTAQSISFNLTGAKAVATSDEGSKGTNRSDAEDAFGLVKILEDGSIEAAMQFSGGAWLPEMQFIAKSPVAEDLYISFS